MGRYSDKHLYFVGLGGIGMSAIAGILLDRGYHISGSDIAESARLQRLEEKGAKVNYTQKAENITQDIDIVVLSSAISAENAEYQQAKAMGKLILHRADMLAYLMEDKKAICIAGAHGKTTTSSMISLMLDREDREPTIIVGGEIPQIQSNAKFGKSDLLVAEADESDGSFVKLHPWMSIVTNIESDHLDHYHNIEEIKAAFVEFVQLTGENGVNIFCCDNPSAMEVAKFAPGKIITYGFSPDAMIRGENIVFENGKNKADIYMQGKLLGRLELLLPGKHNIQNALAAVACGLELGLSFAEIQDGLGQFTGAKRRFQVLSTAGDITVIDDYAHHPTEVQATIAAAKSCKPNRLLAVFQPHRYTRTQFLAKEFAACFDGADQVILTDVYAASEKPIDGVSSQLIADYIKDMPVRVVPQDQLTETLLQMVQPGDFVLMMGAGNIWRNTVKLAEYLQQKAH